MQWVRRKFSSLLQGRLVPTLASKDAYRQWADQYPPVAHNPLMKIEQTALLSLLPDMRRQTVLDLACGTGRYALLARELGAALVIGADNSRPMLQRMEPNPTEAEIDALPFRDGQFGVVICALAVGHLPRERFDTAIREIGRVLLPNGAALISDFHPVLAMSGKRRTFTTNSGTEYAVEHHVHRLSAYTGSAERADLRIEAVAEPIHPVEGISVPVVLVVRLRKTDQTR